MEHILPEEQIWLIMKQILFQRESFSQLHYRPNNLS